MKGANGIEFIDNGDTWRAIGSSSVTEPQVFDYVDRSGRPTGVKYAMGFDTLFGATRIAWVDYPKDLYSLDELTNDDKYTGILMHCNVCNAMDQATARRSRPRSSVESVPSSESERPSRISAGALAPAIPKYIPFGLKLAKSLTLRPTGDVLVSLGLSILSDLLSGFIADPQYRNAVQSFSDSMIDSIDDETIKRVREDALDIAEAALKDGEPFVSKKRISGMLFKTRDDLRKEVESARDKEAASRSRSSQQPAPTINPVSAAPVHIVPRLFE